MEVTKQKKNYLTCTNRLRLSKNQFNLVSELSYFSKNLYNAALYETRQHYFQTDELLEYVDNYHRLKLNENYQILPSQVAQQTMKVVERTMKSYFGLLRERDKGNYNRPVGLPKYLPKSSKFILIFTKAHFKITNRKIKLTCNKELLKKYNLISLSFDFPKHLVGKEIKEVRINPRYKSFNIEYIYNDGKNYSKVNNSSNTLSIDLGLNNLIAMISNVNPQPTLIDGREIKSKNRWVNKKLTRLQSIAKTVNHLDYTFSINKLYQYRNNWINNKFHHISNYIIEYCLSNNISNIVIGYNQEWKQNINLGSQNNQNFVQIPHGKLLGMIKYKAKNHEIAVELQEESYTSKCDALALEPIKKRDLYLGKRLKRGLFKSSTGRLINADINGALNILRKCKGKAFVKELVNSGCVNQPVKIRI